MPEVREVLGGQEGKDRSEVKDKPNNIERSQSHNGTYDHNGSRAEEDKERGMSFIAVIFLYAIRHRLCLCVASVIKSVLCIYHRICNILHLLE